MQLISREPEAIKRKLLDINRKINAFQVDYEGRKISCMMEPEFNRRWAEILDLEATQVNGRRTYMTVYVHPVMCTIRIAKWCPKLNVCNEDQVSLTQAADDLRFEQRLFVVEHGNNSGYYHKCNGEACWMDQEPTKLNISSTSDDSAFCSNCSGGVNTSTDTDFSQDSEFERLTAELNLRQAKKSDKQPTADQVTSSKTDIGDERPQLEVSTIDQNSSTESKSTKYIRKLIFEKKNSR